MKLSILKIIEIIILILEQKFHYRFIYTKIFITIMVMILYMSKGAERTTDCGEPRVTVQAADIDGIASALGMELVEEQESAESPDYPESCARCLTLWQTSTEVSRRPPRPTVAGGRGRWSGSTPIARISAATRLSISSETLRPTTLWFRTAIDHGFLRTNKN